MSKQLAPALETYANGLGRGYLKFYKAVSIIDTLRQMPQIVDNDKRLFMYLDSCLKMEGFTIEGVGRIMRWVQGQKDQLKTG